ncbi:MAG: hypothetical protein Aurels2KO_03760 [Aureliella sp.]
MNKPSRNQPDSGRPSSAVSSGRRLLLEQLENRQLLAGDLAQINLVPDEAQSPPALIAIAQTDAALQHRSGGSSDFAELGLPLVFREFESSDRGRPHHGSSQSHFGRMNAPGNGGGSRGLGHPSSANRLDFGSLGLPGLSFNSNNQQTVISSRITQAALLPALPPGFELIDRVTVTQTPVVPLSSNSDATPTTTNVLILQDNNSVPPSIVAIVNPNAETLENDLNQIRNTSPTSGLVGEGEGPSSEQVTQPSESSPRGRAFDNQFPDNSDAATTALNDALSEFFGSEVTSTDQVALQISARAQEHLRGQGSDNSLAAFFDSISSELRRSGMSREQVAELESLLSQIIEGDPAVRESATWVSSQNASWVQYSRRGAQVYDFSGEMMAVPIDGSPLLNEPIDALSGIASSAWTQRFGLADVALTQLGCYVDGTELGASPFAELGDDDEASWDLLPTGFVSETWRSTAGKASLLAAACLATTRIHKRASTRSLATKSDNSARPRHPR